ncbi:MAG: hypothetical protein CVV06_07360 [Gammaproteobacteria bacterium HGW-Gammaproteobacteria-10]|nr:MAG: hypothetical protein CVV06_07360 [Gammaproteobacteria bacterium HGW-Gammaproteobacteria-10]
MQRRQGRFNTKRKIQAFSENSVSDVLVKKVKYGGNPEHKKNPGDFELTPPSSPRTAKSLCDTVEIFTKKAAIAHIKAGLRKGMISEQMKGKWPQNIWAVTRDGTPLEAQLENPETGMYHGYPMPESDPFSHEVIKEWKIRDKKD